MSPAAGTRSRRQRCPIGGTKPKEGACESPPASAELLAPSHLASLSAYHTNRIGCRGAPSIRTTSNARQPSPTHEAPSVKSSIEILLQKHTPPEEHLYHRSYCRIIGRRVARACREGLPQAPGIGEDRCPVARDQRHGFVDPLCATVRRRLMQPTSAGWRRLEPSYRPDRTLLQSTASVDRSRVQRLKVPGGLQGPGACPGCHGGGDHDQDSGYGDCDEPAHPIDAGAAIAPERGVDEPADQDPTDAANDG
jgi:hypothetical protein